MKNIDKSSFFVSSLNLKNEFQDFNSFEKWFIEKCKPEEFLVKKIPFSEMDKWGFDKNKNKLSHNSGRFFSIEGIDVKTNFGYVTHWEQPIINQPEIGILGIITKIINNNRYFLMQAKMEPGNINTLQISPTLQATKSNLTRVHQGKTPEYLDYFIDPKKSKVLVDQLQSEQGGRFLQKRNRNMVVEIDSEIEVLNDFCWLTLAELKYLLGKDNVLNMDTRSVLSTIPLIEDSLLDKISISELEQNGWSFNETYLSVTGIDYLKSFLSTEPMHSVDEIISWYTKQKMSFEMEVFGVPLRNMKKWQIFEDKICSDDRFFSVIAVKVEAGTREVQSWTQPLIEDPNIGLLAFMSQKINGVLHFLVQAKVEPGNRDIIELSPTVTCSNYQSLLKKENKPFCFEEMLNPLNKVHYNSLQSEEGGRFYKLQNRNMIVELAVNKNMPVPENYIWMTLRQMREFMRYGMFNIEARSLIAALSFI